MAIKNPKGSEAKASVGFDIEPETTTLLIPTHVNENHWMLCVARLPTAGAGRGTLEFYNSLHSTYWNDVCQNGAREVVQVLTRLGSVPGTTFPNAMWSIVGRKGDPQSNSDDCGVFVAACAASVVLETVVPTRVNNFRAVMATQVLERVKGTRLDWDVVKIFFLGLGDDVVEGLEDVVEDLGDKEVGEDFAERHICEWPTETKDQVAMSTTYT